MTTEAEDQIWRVQHDLSFFMDTKNIWKSGLNQYVVEATALNIRDIDKLRNVGIVIQRVIQRVEPKDTGLVKLHVKVVNKGVEW